MPSSPNNPTNVPKGIEADSDLFERDAVAYNAWIQSVSKSNKPARGPSGPVRTLPNLAHHTCWFIAGEKPWWLCQAPDLASNNHQPSASEQLAQQYGLQSCTVSQGNQRWIAVRLDGCRLVGDVVDQWGTPPKAVLFDWREQWKLMTHHLEANNRLHFDLLHIAVFPDGRLVGLGAIVAGQSEASETKLKSVTNETEIIARSFDVWLRENTQDINETKQPNLASSNPTAKQHDMTAVPTDDKDSSTTRSPKFTLEPKQPKHAGSTKTHTPKLQTTKTYSIKALAIWSIAAVAIVVIPFVAISQTRNKPKNRDTIADHTNSKAASADESPDQSKSQSSLSSEKSVSTENSASTETQEPEPELDISGTEPSASPILSVDATPTPPPTLMANRLDSFFSAIESNAIGDLTNPHLENMVSAEDIVRGSMGDASQANEPVESAVSENASDLEQSSSVDQPNEDPETPSSDLSNLVGRDSLKLEKSITKHILRMNARPVLREAILRLQLTSDVAKNILPASQFEIAGKNGQGWSIKSPELPGELLIKVQSIPAKQWEIRFGVVYKSANIPDGVFTDPKTSTALLQRLLTYQGWLSGQLSQARANRDNTQDTNLRRVMLEGIKVMETEEKYTEQIVEGWQKFDTYLAKFFADHEITIIAAGTRAALDSAIQADGAATEEKSADAESPGAADESKK